MSNYVIMQTRDGGPWTTWAFDPSARSLFEEVSKFEPPRHLRDKSLTTVGDYVLAYGRLDRARQQVEFSLLTFHPDRDAPWGRPVQAGTWPAEKFLNYYVYRDCPQGPKVDDLRLIGITGYVLCFLPTRGRGSFGLWNFDAASGTPGGRIDPLTETLFDPDAFPEIGCGSHASPGRQLRHRLGP